MLWQFLQESWQTKKQGPLQDLLYSYTVWKKKRVQESSVLLSSSLSPPFFSSYLGPDLPLFQPSPSICPSNHLFSSSILTYIICPHFLACLLSSIPLSVFYLTSHKSPKQFYFHTGPSVVYFLHLSACASINSSSSCPSIPLPLSWSFHFFLFCPSIDPSFHPFICPSFSLQVINLQSCFTRVASSLSPHGPHNISDCASMSLCA